MSEYAYARYSSDGWTENDSHMIKNMELEELIEHARLRSSIRHDVRGIFDDATYFELHDVEPPLYLFAYGVTYEPAKTESEADSNE